MRSAKAQISSIVAKTNRRVNFFDRTLSSICMYVCICKVRTHARVLRMICTYITFVRACIFVCWLTPCPAIYPWIFVSIYYRFKIDITQECHRLLEGFSAAVRNSERYVHKTIQELRKLVEVPAWQKSVFWAVGNHWFFCGTQKGTVNFFFLLFSAYSILQCITCTQY